MNQTTTSLGGSSEPVILDIDTKPFVMRLPSPVHCGDWHDKPLRWNVAWGSKNQMFATRKDAEAYARLWRRHGYLGEYFAISDYSRLGVKVGAR